MEAGGDGGVVPSLCDFAEDLGLAGVSSASGDLACRARDAINVSTTLGSMTEPPRATSRIALATWSSSVTLSFSR
jgi:hypothetical protein